MHGVCSPRLGACRAARAAGSGSDKARARTRERSPWRGGLEMQTPSPSAAPCSAFAQSVVQQGSKSKSKAPRLPWARKPRPGLCRKALLERDKFRWPRRRDKGTLGRCSTFTLAKSSSLEREKSIDGFCGVCCGFIGTDITQGSPGFSSARTLAAGSSSPQPSSRQADCNSPRLGLEGRRCERATRGPLPCLTLSCFQHGRVEPKPAAPPRLAAGTVQSQHRAQALLLLGAAQFACK